VVCKIKNPSHGSGTPDILPRIPPSFGIPDPVDFHYVYGGTDQYPRSYISYLMTGEKKEGESYTYGERLTRAPIEGFKYDWFKSRNLEILYPYEVDGRIIFEEDGVLYLNQIEAAIETYKKGGFRNNQIVLQVAHPTDMLLVDPPCLRQIDTRIQADENGVMGLNFIIEFRSWDLWGGFPANLAGIEALQSYMASSIGVAQHCFLTVTKGLHLYGYAEDLAKIRCMKDSAACDQIYN